MIKKNSSAVRRRLYKPLGPVKHNPYVMPAVISLFLSGIAVITFVWWGGDAVVTQLAPSSSSSSAPAWSSSSSSSIPWISSSSSSSSSSLATLVVRLPLLSNYSNTANPSLVPSVLGDASCAQFTSHGWLQTCSATLSLDAPVESGNTTICFASSLTGFPSMNTSFLLSCRQNVDCLQVFYYATYGIMAAQINQKAGCGFGVVVSLSTWFHVCVSYEDTTSTLSLYYNGDLVGSQHQPHCNTTYGTPLLAGAGSSATFPALGYFQNWRVYNAYLPASNVSDLADQDTPSYGPSPSSPSLPNPVVIPSSSSSTGVSSSSSSKSVSSSTGMSSSSSSPKIASSSSSTGISSSSSSPPVSNSSVDYCLGYGGADSSACLYLLMKTPGVLTVPVSNFVYYVNLHRDDGAQYPLFLGPNTVFNGNNCTFYLLPYTTAYSYDPSVGWYEGPQKSNYGWYNFLMILFANSVLSNVTFYASIPTSGVSTNDGDSNIRMLYVTFSGLPAIFVNASSSDSVKRSAINIGIAATNIEVGWCYFYNVGYAVILDNPYLANIEIHHNVIQNVTGDGVCINAPTFGEELGQFDVAQGTVSVPYYWIPYAATNISIHHNNFSFTGFSSFGNGNGNFYSEAFGFGVSVAGGMNVTIDRNRFYRCTWQAMHVEAHSHYTFMTNNVVDGVEGKGNPFGYWLGTYTGVWFALSTVAVVSGNTFSNIPDAAVLLQNTAYDYCIPNTGPSTNLPCIPYPESEWYSQSIVVGPNNVFLGWGSDTPNTHAFAVSVNGDVLQSVNVSVFGNTYNPSGSTRSNSFVYCNCISRSVVIKEPSIPLYGCSDQLMGDVCDLVPANTNGLLGMWSAIAVASPERALTLPTQSYNSNFNLTTYPLPAWTGVNSAVVLIASSTPPLMTPCYTGMPGAAFASPSQSMTGPSIWPTAASYSVVAILIPQSSSSGPIFGRLSIVGGQYCLVHAGVAACGPPVVVNRPVLVVATYASGSVSFYVNNTAATTATMSASNVDVSLVVGGGGFQGVLYDVELFSTALSASDVTGLVCFYMYGFSGYIPAIYVSLFGGLHHCGDP